MDSYKRLVEIAIERIAAGEEPPAEAIPVPEGEDIIPHEPVNYRIPDGFPNPPPPSPLIGIRGIGFILTQCGMTNDQITRFIGTEVSTLQEFAEISCTDVDEQIKTLARATGNGRVILGLGVPSRIKSAIKLLHNLKRSGDGVLDAYDVSIPTLQEWQIESQTGVDGDDKIKVSPPDKFEHKNWVSFKDGIENYFRQTKGTQGIPLFYVIRGNKRPTGKMSFIEKRIWNARLSGPDYDRDNSIVLQQLIQVLRDTDAWAYLALDEFMKNQDGRGAWKNTCRHYDGPHAVERRVADANRDLLALYYKSEAQFPLERYVTQMTNCFRILEENGEPKSERDKMDHFLNQIQNPNENLRTYIARIRMDVAMRKDFQAASNALLEAVSTTLQERGATSGNRKVAKTNTKRNNSGGDSKDKSKNKKQKGQDKTRNGPPTGPYTLEEKNGKKFCNGVDITNVKRTFTNEEWGKMGDYTQVLKASRKVAAVRMDDNSNSNNSAGNGNRFGTGAQDA